MSIPVGKIEVIETSRSWIVVSLLEVFVWIWLATNLLIVIKMICGNVYRDSPASAASLSLEHLTVGKTALISDWFSTDNKVLDWLICPSFESFLKWCYDGYGLNHASYLSALGF